MTWFMACLLVVSFVWTGWNEFRAPILWNTPTRVDSSWFRYFPDASSEEIRYFLELVVEAFVFSQNYQSYLLPEQSIASIYDHFHPIGNINDSLEIESLQLIIEREYGCELSSQWNNQFTLAELFAAVRFVVPQAEMQPV